MLWVSKLSQELIQQDLLQRLLEYGGRIGVLKCEG